MFLRDIEIKTIKTLIDSSKIDDKKLLFSLFNQLFWFVLLKLEAVSTQNSFNKKLAIIVHNILNEDEFKLFKIYFERQFYIIEKWFHLNEELFAYMIELFLLMIHMNFYSYEETETKILQNIIKTILLVMENSTNQQKIHVIAIRILFTIMKESKDSVLHMISFDRYQCIQLVMQSMVNSRNTNMNQMAIQISYLLIKEISFEEISNLFSNKSYVKTLLDFVESHSEKTSNPDFFLNLSLCLIWNLTDESQKICELIVEQNGLNLLFLLLNV
jgi:hypothetical protein